MEPERIREAIASVAEHFTANPADARGEDKPARAILQSGLRIRVEGPGSWSVLTDMPPALGGEGSAPSPGWLRRAAQAACEATMIAIRAAQEGIALQSLEVTIQSVSDDRGMLGLADANAGPIESSALVVISAEGVSADKLRSIVEWGEAHSPVTDALCRAVPHKLQIQPT
ncbi:MAG TPA: OsmC family protein [Anaerolineales bacterium]|nr:OsmC family protein [Anaerolineales bacterium]